MEIRFLGTSAAVPTFNRAQSSIALKAFGEVILFDCGESAQRQLLFAKVSPMKITKIFLSHLHGDHILGLPGLIQSMDLRGREKELCIYGPKGTLQLKSAIENLGNCTINFPVKFIEIDEGKIIENEEYIIKCVRTKHNTHSLAYSIEEKKKPKFLKSKAIELGVPVGPAFGKLHNGEEVEINGKIIKPEQVLGEKKKGKKITYSGDTMPCESLIYLAKESDILIHEATYNSEEESLAIKHGHSTSKDAAMIAKASNSKKLYITHFSPRYDDISTLIKESREIFQETYAAKDLMKVEL